MLNYMAQAYNNRVSGSGLQPLSKPPSATSDTRQPLSEIGCDGFKYDKKLVN